MIPHPASAETPNPADQQAEDAQYYRRVLHELIDMGADLARMVHGQAKAQGEADASTEADDGACAGAGAGTAADLAVAFDRIARAVRRSIALARTLSDPVPLCPARDDALHRTAARKRIIREVEDVIQRKAEGSDAEALYCELRERLDAPDLDDDIRGRPVADVIADICRDLGIAAMPGTRPWKRRGPAELATLSARAAAPPGAGACPGLAVVPRGVADSGPSPGHDGNPTTPLLSATRFRGK